MAEGEYGIPDDVGRYSLAQLVELPVGFDDADEIPGDPGRLRDLVSRLHSGWEALRQLRHRTSEIQNAAWRGPAAEAFRGEARKLPAQIGVAEARFWGAYWHLRPFINALEKGQADDRRARQAFDTKMDAHGRAVQRWEQLRMQQVNGGDVGDELAVARAELSRAKKAVRDELNRIRSVRQDVAHAAWQTAGNLEKTIADGLRDDPGANGFKRWLRNPPWWLGLVPHPLAPLLASSAKLASTEIGRETLEGTSDALAMAGVIPGPIGAAAGLASIPIDLALYGHGRTDGTDLGLDALGAATFGVGMWPEALPRAVEIGSEAVDWMTTTWGALTGAQETGERRNPPPMVPVGPDDLAPPEMG